MEVTVKRDGLTLRGTLTTPQTPQFDLVLLMHGFSGTRGTTPDNLLYQLAERLDEAGLATLRFDFDGHGESDGRFEDMSVLGELLDGQAFIDYARQVPGVRRLYLLGHSQGGVVASMLAGYDHDLVDKLVLLAPAATLQDDALKGDTRGHQYDPQHIPDQIKLDNHLTLGGFYLRSAQTLPIYPVASQYHGPVCLIHGTADTVVDQVASTRYHEAFTDSTLHLIDGADHLLRENGARLPVLQLVVDFLTR